MRVKFIVLLSILAAVLMPLQAATVVYIADLDGPSESPANDSPGSGSTRVTVDSILHTMRVEVTFADLEGLTTASHIHIGRPTGGVVTTVPTFPGFPLGVQSGTYDQTFDLTLASTYNPSFLNNAVNLGNVTQAESTLLAGLAGGDAYLNVHSTIYPGGEIRGFLAPVPEPATFAIGGAALAGLALLRRRQARVP
jgi:hypothetical protein